MSEELIAVPAKYSVENPWSVPASCRPAPLHSATDGAPPRVATTVAAYFDDRHLTLVFEGEDAGVVATHLEHDAPLYEEDVVEAFLAPHSETEYFEIEVNPLGTVFDARVVSPDGVRSTMRVDRGWTCEGIFAAVMRTDVRLAVVMRIPFSALGAGTPRPGETWRANFYRIDRSRDGDEYLAWSPTLRSPADFHVPGAFGALRFV